MSLSEILSQGFVLIQFLAALTAIFFWKNYKNTILWIFIPFLVYSFLNELSVLIINFELGIKTRPFYNVFTMLSFFVYLYFFDRLLKLKSIKYIVILIFALAVIYDIIVFDFTKLYKASLFTVSFMILIFSVTYFVKLLKSDEVINYKKIPEFWIILGLLLFYMAFTPLLAVTGIGYGVTNAYYIAINILNYILYCCYIIGFYVTGK